VEVGSGRSVVAVAGALREQGLLPLGWPRWRRLLSTLFEGPRLVVWPVSLAGVLVFGIAVSGGVGSLAGPGLALLVAAALAEAFPVPI
jgi:hypothetical protein